MSARVFKKNFKAASTVAATDGLQETLRDETFEDEVTLVSGFWYWSAIAATTGGTGFMSIYWLILKAAEAIPTITEATLDALHEDLWQQVMVPIGPSGLGYVFLPVGTKRTVKAGSRMVMVATYNLSAAISVTRGFTGQLIVVSA